MSQIFGEYAHGAFFNKNNSAIINYFMRRSGMLSKTMSRYLGCGSVGYFYNKLARNSFSIEDLMVASYVCGVDLDEIDPYEYISNLPDVRSRIERVKADEREAMKARYYEKKRELEEMEKRYGFGLEEGNETEMS